MSKKIKVSTEFAYVIGMIVIAIGTALITKANFGVNIVVAPAYIFHLYMQSIGLTYYTFGVCQYIAQGILVIAVAAVCKRFKKSYLFAFVSAVIEGYLLDLALWTLPDASGLGLQIFFYTLGQVVLALGISFMLKTYITPEVYELAIVEFTELFAKSQTYASVTMVKIIYDACMCILAVLLSFIFFGFGEFRGLGVGTIVNMIIAGFLIGAFTKVQDTLFEYVDCLKLRRYFS